MVQVAVRSGIRTLVATPHVNRRYANRASTILPLVEDLNRRIRDQGLELEVRHGAEVALLGTAQLGAEELVPAAARRWAVAARRAADGSGRGRRGGAGDGARRPGPPRAARPPGALPGLPRGSRGARLAGGRGRARLGHGGFAARPLRRGRRPLRARAAALGTDPQRGLRCTPPRGAGRRRCSASSSGRDSDRSPSGSRPVFRRRSWKAARFPSARC